MSSSLKLFRQIHRYVGLFIAPALLFFSFTGALQTFSLHETTQGSSYKPPAWIVMLGQVHKKQTTIVPVRKLKADTPKPEKAPDPATQPVPKAKNHLPLKSFFLLVAIGLFTSTGTGIYMAYKYERSKLLVTGLLLAGIVIPLLLLPF
jgi:hypothetical protein